MRKRRRFSAEFKARVALEALTGVHTMSELSSKHGVHPNMISQWKHRVQDGLPELFSRKSSNGDSSRESEIKELHAKTCLPAGTVGQLTVEKDFLSRAFGQ
ncbi:MAG: transposase [candidate division Zixibacteria bacterium]|nr:transposase [candidate division Zixibacteria bacterium]